jgi:drug/metabolite transporter (DMT)-like permease
MVLIASGTAPAAKFAVRELPTGLIPMVRFGVAGLCLLPLVWRGGALGRMLREEGGRLLVTAALCVPVNQFFFLNGTRLAPTSHVALIYAVCPLVVLLLVVALGEERLAVARLAGIFVAVLGIVVIGLGNRVLGASEGRSALRGDTLIVGAVVSWGAYLTLSKRLVARYVALPALAGTFLAGSLLGLVIAATTHWGWPSWSAVSWTAWAGLAYLTLVASALGLSLQNQALRRLDASQVATVGNAAPLLTILWGVWLFHEPVTAALVVGGILTLGGVLWTGCGQPTARLARRPVATPCPEPGRLQSRS